MIEFKNLEELEKIGEYLISVLAAVLQNKEAPDLPDGITWQQVYEMACFHSVESMAFYGVKDKLRRDEALISLFAKWEKRCNQNLVRSLTQEGELKEVIRSLTHAGIRVMLLKGGRLRKLYRQIDFRQMSDLDILIDKEHTGQAGQILEKLGYEMQESVIDHHSIYCKLPHMLIELHTSMEPQESRFYNYCPDIWDRASEEKETPGSYVLNAEDFLIYHMVHFARHFESGGSGIRSLMDIQVLTDTYRNTLDRKYLKKELSRIQLTDFCTEMEQLSRNWFAPGKTTKKSQKMTALERDIFLSGTYGSRLRGFFAHTNSSYFLSRIFMGKDELKFSYPILQKYPFLFGICWVHRLFRIALFQRDSVWQELNWRKMKTR